MRAQTLLNQSVDAQPLSLISRGYVNQMCSVPGCLFSPKCRYQGVLLCHKHFANQYIRDRRPAPTDPRYFLGAFGEAAIRNIFVAHGRRLEDQASKCKFDFLVDGWRVEVKTVTPRKRKGGWVVNFQRNGILDEHTDFYVVRLESEHDPINLLLPGPVGQKSMLFQRGVMIWQRRDDFNRFANGDFGIKP